MAYSYDEMQGSPMDPDDHPADSGHNRDQYAGGITPIRIPANDNKNLDLGTGGISESDINASWNSLRKSLSKPTLKIVPKS